MYNSLSPTLRLFTSNSDHLAPEQVPLGEQSGDPDAVHHHQQDLQVFPEDLSPDMIALKYV